MPLQMATSWNKISLTFLSILFVHLVQLLYSVIISNNDFFLMGFSFS